MEIKNIFKGILLNNIYKKRLNTFNKLLKSYN